MDCNETEWVRAPPTTGTFCERLGRIIYNPDDKSVFGRTAKRWGIVLIFYVVFYALLALLFAACMGCLLLTLDDKVPTYTLEYSLIGVNPGVTYRPLPDVGVTVTVDFNMTPDNFTYIKQLDEFFDAYRGDRWYFLKSGCNSVDNYGYPETPCFFIKINKIFGWKPDYYDSEYLPEEMPSDLLDYIATLERDEAKQVWISCSEDNLNQTLIEYPWGRGLPVHFYPYENGKGYKSPLVAVRLTPPVNKLVKIHCRAWAKNIIYNKSIKHASGYTSIELLIEDANKTEIVI